MQVTELERKKGKAGREVKLRYKQEDGRERRMKRKGSTVEKEVKKERKEKGREAEGKELHGEIWERKESEEGGKIDRRVGKERKGMRRVRGKGKARVRKGR